MGGNSLSAGVGWPQLLWGANQGGLLDNTAGPPVFTFGGNIPYSAVGQNWQNFGYEKNDRWQFSNDLTWVKGRHTAKFGIEYRRHIFPNRGWATATGGHFDFNRVTTSGFDAAGNSLAPTGDPFASFLLGQTQSADQTIPVYPTFNEALHGGVGERRVQGQRQADADARIALRLPVRAVGAGRLVLDVRSQHAESRRGWSPRRADFRRRLLWMLGSRQVRRPEEGRVGSESRVRVSARRAGCDSRRLWGLLRRRLVLAVHGSADAWLRRQLARSQPDERRAPSVLSG